MEELQEALKTANLKDQRQYKEIYSHVKQNIVPNARDQPAPLFILAATIRAITTPEFILDKIPILLDLLAETEGIRRRLRKSAEDALEWHELYSREGDEKNTLSAREHAHMVYYAGTEKSEAYRIAYMNTILALCELHLWHVATSATEQSSLFIDYMNDYFSPSLHARQAPRQLRKFHHGLTAEERKMLRDAEQDCEELWTQISLWEQDKELDALDRGIPLSELHGDPDALQKHVDDLLENFPCPLKVDDLVQLTEHHVRTVETLAKHVEPITDKYGL